MLYKKYYLYDNRIEIMLPSDYEQNNKSFYFSDYNWVSPDGKAVIDVNIIENNGNEKLIYVLQDYYLEYKRLLEDFSCRHIIMRKIYEEEFGEIKYYSLQYGYRAYSCLNLAILEDKLVTISISCFEEELESFDHIFSNIMDSVRIKREEAK